MEQHGRFRNMEISQSGLNINCALFLNRDVEPIGLSSLTNMMLILNWLSGPIDR